MLETRQANEPVYYVADQLQETEQRQNQLKSLEVSLFLLKTLKNFFSQNNIRDLHDTHVKLAEIVNTHDQMIGKH